MSLFGAVRKKRASCSRAAERSGVKRSSVLHPPPVAKRSGVASFILPRVAKRSGGGGPRVARWRGLAMRAPKRTMINARQLRRTLSMPEARLWRLLRARVPGRPVFRRQHPIGPYVLDFYCAKARLAIEIDGLAHEMGNRPQRDIRRDEWLASQGVTVVRIDAGQLTSSTEIDEAADAILRMAVDMLQGPLHHASHGSPPPLRGGG